MRALPLLSKDETIRTYYPLENEKGKTKKKQKTKEK